MTQGSEQMISFTIKPKVGFLALMTYLSVAPMCTILYAMMRTQKSKNQKTNLMTFILGLPLSLIPHFGISE